MTRAEAETEAARLAAESPDRDTHQWVPRDEGDGNWSVVRIGLAPSTEPTGTEVSADERPGSTMESAEARGKHLLLHFDRGLALHSHLGMRGSWRISERESTNDRRAWVVLSAPGAEAAELGGSHLDLRTEAELRSNPQLRSLGPDVLADDFDAAAGMEALRA